MSRVETVNTRNMLQELIKKARKQHKLTQEDVSKASGISVDRLSKIENGNGSVSLDELDKLIQAVGLRVLVYVESQSVTFPV